VEETLAYEGKLMTLLDRAIGPKLHHVLVECLLTSNLSLLLQLPPEIPTEALYAAQTALEVSQTPFVLLLA